MISTYKHNKVTWVDLENPNQDEVKKIAEKYGINPDVAHDLLSPTARPVIEEHKNYIYLIIHFPVGSESNLDVNNPIQEIDFIIGKDFIITNRYITFDSIIDFAKRFTVNSILKKDEGGGEVGLIFYKILKGLYAEINHRLEYINQNLKESESNIFNGNEKSMVVELSKINRLLLHINKSISIHDEVLLDVIKAGNNIFDFSDIRHFKNVLGEYLKIKSLVNSLKDYTAELRSTNDSLLSSKQNEIMKFLTIMAFATFPISIIANLFQMGTIHTPIVGMNNDFWIIISFMMISVASLFILFKIKKWF